MTERLFNTEEAAELLTVSSRTVKRLKANGDLAFVMVGGSVRFTEREIARYLRSRERRAKAA